MTYLELTKDMTLDIRVEGWLVFVHSLTFMLDRPGDRICTYFLIGSISTILIVFCALFFVTIYVFLFFSCHNISFFLMLRTVYSFHCFHFHIPFFFPNFKLGLNALL